MSFEWDNDIWTFLGEQFSAVPDAEYPWDPELVRRVQAVDPGYVPLFCRRSYATPSGRVSVGFHMMGRRLLGPPHGEVEYLHVLRPTSGGPRGVNLGGGIIAATVWEGPHPRRTERRLVGYERSGDWMVPAWEEYEYEQQDRPGAFMALDGRFEMAVRYSLHRLRNVAAEERSREVVRIQREAVQAAIGTVSKETMGARREYRSYRVRRPASSRQVAAA